MYALAPELRTIVEYLNEDANVAFIVADGPRRWRAVERVGDLAPGHHAIWLRAHGPLPLVESPGVEPSATIADPMAGWDERVPASTPAMPFFGSDPAVVWAHVPRFDEHTSVPMTAFGWIGDRYRGIDHGASAAARQWWRRLQKWIRSRTEIVRRGGPDGTGPKDVAAFPDALARLQSGVPGDLNPPAP
jgi:hypothetical protein